MIGLRINQGRKPRVEFKIRKGINKGVLNIHSCTEIKDLASTYSYFNYANIGQTEAKEIFFKGVYVGKPRLIEKESRRGEMTVATKSQVLTIDGRFGELLALYVLCKGCQRGTVICRYCDKVIGDEGCQIRGFLHELSQRRGRIE